MSLEGIDDIHSGDSLSLGVLSVSDGIFDDSLEEVLQDLSGVLIDEERDSLDTASSGESSDGWLGDALQKWLSSGSGVSLGSDLSDAFSDSFSSFSSSGHCNI